MQTIPDSEEISLGLYDIYPHELPNGATCWIERYAVGSEGELKRGLVTWLVEDGVQMAHLVPGETLTSGIRKTVQWYLNHGDWCRHVQDGTYQRQRLGARQ